MAYDYEIVAWEGFPRRGQTRGNRYGVDYTRQGEPKLPRVGRVHGVKVILTNPNAPGDTHQYWLYTRQRFNKWGQWFVFISADATRHGFVLEDETIPPDPVPEEDF